MSKIQIAPSMLFQYSVKVRQLPAKKIESAAVVLSDEFCLPNFSQLNDASKIELKIEPRLAWSESGLWFQLEVIMLKSIQTRLAKGATIRVFLDTRGATGNKRLTQFCHQFAVNLDLQRKQTTVHVVDNRKPNSMSEDQSLARPSVHADFRADAILLCMYFPANVLKGFQPKEFPQISYFYDLLEGTQPLINAGTDSRVKYDIDPSVWIRGQLV